MKARSTGINTLKPPFSFMTFLLADAKYIGELDTYGSRLFHSHFPFIV